METPPALGLCYPRSLGPGSVSSLILAGGEGTTQKGEKARNKRMSDVPEWKWHWYQHAIGVGLVRIAAVWNDRAEPTLRLGDDTLELVRGSQEAAVKEFAAQRNEFLFVGKPPEELDS